MEAALERLLREEAPVVVAVDDAHWLDDASSRVLARLARGSATLGTAVVFTARPGGFAPAGVPELRLEPLDAASARLLFGRAAGDLTREVTEHLLQLAAGNPLALLELPRGLRPAQRLGLERVEAGHDLTESLLRTFGGRLRRICLIWRRRGWRSGARRCGLIWSRRCGCCGNRRGLRFARQRLGRLDPRP